MSGFWFLCVCLFLSALCFQFPDGAGVSQVCWVTGAIDLLIALEEYLSRRLPALRCQGVCLLWQKPEPYEHSSLNLTSVPEVTGRSRLPMLGGFRLDFVSKYLAGSFLLSSVS
ncbi:hypothetical protein ILYODFUR_032628 [Ilyodon furcidens]|uniref:Secreted protein n=1 Tax=Ilyodon furcidens TaxID=33524 RepID=A0ABV0TZM2_9TELE